MTDESQEMDKKIIPPNKGGSEGGPAPRASALLNTKQDGPGSNLQSKSYLRGNSRRRIEPNASTSCNGPITARTEQGGRRPNYQKGKVADREKKPKQRGGYPGEGVNVDKKELEVRSLQATGGKKQNWNHLLTFHFAPRERTWSSSWQSHNTHPGRYRNDSGGAAVVSKSKFSKENFLQANCQFMVKAGRDYSVYLADPDILVEWNAIEQIIVKMVGEGTSCPICLSSPVAAKMTRCGHIFCWPCMLHYLALSDQKFRSCPICYEHVCKEDLKSVVSQIFFDADVGDHVEMQLVCRPKDMLEVSPVLKSEVSPEWQAMYAKLLIVSPNDVMSKILNRELKELQIHFEQDPDCPEVCFVHQAIQEIKLREETVRSNNIIPVDETETGKFANSSDEEEEDSNMDEKSASLDNNVEFEDENVNCLDRNGFYYFFQASDGQNIFLHPVNMAMLWKSCGNDMSQWPQRVSFRVIEKEFFAASEDTRKRLKFLRHLPLNTPFQLVEVKLKGPFMNSEISKEFESQLQFRKGRREERANNEKRMEKYMEEKERQRHALPLLPKIESKLEFPEFGDGAVDGLYGAQLNPIEETSREWGEDEEFQPLPGSSTDLFSPGLAPPKSSSSVSFAQMAGRIAIRRSPTFPGCIGVGAWGQSQKSSEVNISSAINRQCDSENEGEDYSSVPTFQNSMSDAIAKALESVDLQDEEVTISGQQKRKKKNKGKVLFATGMGCRN